MSQCPVCQAKILDAFGIVQCPECKTMLVAEFDGTLKVHSEGAQDLQETLAEPSVNESLQASPPIFEPIQPIEDNASKWELEVSEKKDSEDLTEKSHVVLHEIHKFGESDDSKLEEGDLIYKLTFSEIHSLEIKNEILDCIKEKRLAISENQIQISKDCVIIENLNPVKLSMIVSKTKGLRVDISWEQQTLLE